MVFSQDYEEQDYTLYGGYSMFKTNAQNLKYFRWANSS